MFCLVVLSSQLSFAGNKKPNHPQGCKEPQSRVVTPSRLQQNLSSLRECMECGRECADCCYRECIGGIFRGIVQQPPVDTFHMTCTACLVGYVYNVGISSCSEMK